MKKETNHDTTLYRSEGGNRELIIYGFDGESGPLLHIKDKGVLVHAGGRRDSAVHMPVIGKQPAENSGSTNQLEVEQ